MKNEEFRTTLITAFFSLWTSLGGGGHKHPEMLFQFGPQAYLFLENKTHPYSFSGEGQ